MINDTLLEKAYDKLFAIFEPNRKKENVTIKVRELLDIINLIDDAMDR